MNDNLTSCKKKFRGQEIIFYLVEVEGPLILKRINDQVFNTFSVDNLIFSKLPTLPPPPSPGSPNPLNVLLRILTSFPTF